MVRIKQRYFLINILFPTSSPVLLSSKTSTPIPDLLHFNQPCPQSFTADLLRLCIRRAVESTFGDYGSASIGPNLRGTSNLSCALTSLTVNVVVYFSAATSTAIIRVQREHYRLLWAALTLSTSIPVGPGKHDSKVECVIRVVRVSGRCRLCRRTVGWVKRGEGGGWCVHRSGAFFVFSKLYIYIY